MLKEGLENKEKGLQYLRAEQEKNVEATSGELAKTKQITEL